MWQPRTPRTGPPTGSKDPTGRRQDAATAIQAADFGRRVLPLPFLERRQRFAGARRQRSIPYDHGGETLRVFRANSQSYQTTTILSKERYALEFECPAEPAHRVYVHAYVCTSMSAGLSECAKPIRSRAIAHRPALREHGGSPFEVVLWTNERPWRRVSASTAGRIGMSLPARAFRDYGATLAAPNPRDNDVERHVLGRR